MPHMPKAAVLAVLSVLALVGACASPDLRLYEGASRPAAQVAVVTMPEQLELASLNGREVPGAKGMANRGDKRLELAPGRYEALVYYREVWQANGESDVLRSDPALFVIDAQAGHRYRLDYERPRGYDAARRLSKAFTGWIADETTGARTASTDSALKFRGDLMAQVTGDSSLVPATQRAGEDPAAPAVQPLPPALPSVPPLAPSPAASAPTASVPAASAGASAGSGDWLALMKGWWRQASAEERRGFLRWVGEQP